MKRITLLNIKGGCGKTTIATNLAAYYANKDIKTSLTDYDPQGSSIAWLNRRSKSLPEIHCLRANDRSAKTTRAWQLHPPRNTEISIIDTPAGVDKLELNMYADKSDTILVPVMPSPVDMFAAAHFIESLLIKSKAKVKGKNIGIIANRIQANTLSYRALEKFLSRMEIPLIAHFRDTQTYIHASTDGLGIHELKRKEAAKDIEQWKNLIDWLDSIPH